MVRQPTAKIALGAVGAALAVTACGADAGATRTTGTAAGGAKALPVGGAPVKLDPAELSTKIDNPYFPLTPGDRRVYRETGPDGTKGRVVVTVTNKTKRIANGVTARVVRDTVSEAGKGVIEDTFDWYAQDKAGNVWYLGEDTKEYENGKVTSTAGSFEAGVDGAQPGVAMPGDPKVGLRYRQEYFKGEAEDAGEVFSLGERVEVPFGSFDRVLMTKDTTPLQPKILEYKLYARNVGTVLALGISGGSDREELVSFRRGRG